ISSVSTAYRYTRKVLLNRSQACVRSVCPTQRWPPAARASAQNRKVPANRLPRSPAKFCLKSRSRPDRYARLAILPTESGWNPPAQRGEFARRPPASAAAAVKNSQISRKLPPRSDNSAEQRGRIALLQRSCPPFPARWLNRACKKKIPDRVELPAGNKKWPRGYRSDRNQVAGSGPRGT